MSVTWMMTQFAAIEQEQSLWQVGTFELALLIAGGVITIGMVIAFIIIFLRKDDQQASGDQ